MHTSVARLTRLTGIFSNSDSNTQARRALPAVVAKAQASIHTHRLCCPCISPSPILRDAICDSFSLKCEPRKTRLSEITAALGWPPPSTHFRLVKKPPLRVTALGYGREASSHSAHPPGKCCTATASVALHLRGWTLFRYSIMPWSMYVPRRGNRASSYQLIQMVLFSLVGAGRSDPFKGPHRHKLWALSNYILHHTCMSS